MCLCLTDIETLLALLKIYISIIRGGNLILNFHLQCKNCSLSSIFLLAFVFALRDSDA